MVLLSISGKLLIDRLMREKIPKIAMAMNINAVVMGVLTAALCKLMLLLLFFDCRIRYRGSLRGSLSFDSYFNAVLQFDLAFSHDLVSFIDSRQNHITIFNARAKFYILVYHGIAVHRVDEMLA